MGLKYEPASEPLHVGTRHRRVCLSVKVNLRSEIDRFGLSVRAGGQRDWSVARPGTHKVCVCVFVCVHVCEREIEGKSVNDRPHTR